MPPAARSPPGWWTDIGPAFTAIQHVHRRQRASQTDEYQPHQQLADLLGEQLPPSRPINP